MGSECPGLGWHDPELPAAHHGIVTAGTSQIYRVARPWGTAGGSAQRCVTHQCLFAQELLSAHVHRWGSERAPPSVERADQECSANKRSRAVRSRTQSELR